MLLPLGPSLSCNTSTGTVHTSHTIQDVVNIDLAWLRTSAQRYWDCNKAWWAKTIDTQSRVKAWADSGPTWWHVKDQVTFPYVAWQCPDGGVCASATVWARTTFRVDVLHCNRLNTNSIELDTETITYPDGSYTVYFDKYGSCAGLHSSTAMMTNNSNSRGSPGGYGGSGFCWQAIPSAQTTPSAQASCYQAYEPPPV
jgi:hypothetical protein